MKHGKKFFVGGLLNLGAGLGTAAYGAYQENQAKKKMAQADALAEGPIRSQAARQRIAQQESDAQSAIDSTLRAQATAAEQIAQQGGSRGLVSATPGLIRATDLASQGAIDQFGQRNAAIRRAEESAATDAQRADYTTNMDRLTRAADAARKTTVGGVTQAIMGGAEMLGDYVNKKQDKTGDDDTQIDFNVLDPNSNQIRLDNMSNMRNDINTGLLDYAKNQKREITDRIFRDLNNPAGAGIPENTTMLDEVEVTSSMAEGGMQEPVEKTPGKFDHDDNPIDIMQEGAKIGEMTGGEYIFNPEQAAEMRKLSEEGDSELHQFIRNLLSKERFQ